MRLFYKACPIRDALHHELSWTHYRTLLIVESETARSWYMAEAADQGRTTRALERQINTLYYERLLGSSDRPAAGEPVFPQQAGAGETDVSRVAAVARTLTTHPERSFDAYLWIRPQVIRPVMQRLMDALAENDQAVEGSEQHQ